MAVGAFYGRRFLRLAPELYGLLLLTALAGPLYGQHASAGDVAAGAGYATNYLYAFGREGSLRWSQLWSLAVEEHFYLTFPRSVRAAAAPALGRSWRRCWLCCGAALVWRLAAHGLGLPERYTYAATECRLDSIAWGCATAVAFGLYGGRWTRRPRSAAAAGALGLALLGVSLVVRDAGFRETARYSLQSFGLAGVFAALFLTDAGARLRRGRAGVETVARARPPLLRRLPMALRAAADRRRGGLGAGEPQRRTAGSRSRWRCSPPHGRWPGRRSASFLRPARALRRRLGSRPLSSPPLGLAEAGGGA